MSVVDGRCDNLHANSCEFQVALSVFPAVFSAVLDDFLDVTGYER